MMGVGGAMVVVPMRTGAPLRLWRYKCLYHLSAGSWADPSCVAWHVTAILLLAVGNVADFWACSDEHDG
jgi:hypothetical protein